MLQRRSRSSRYIGIFAAVLVMAILALFMVAPAAQASGPGCSSWYGTYWNNRDLQGQPTLHRCDEAIDFDWHGLSPDVSINVDNFSARWVRTYNFAEGSYRFKATMDDGMRFYLDGKLLINDWQEANVRTDEVDVYLSGGPHKMTVEYFEAGGNAVAGFTWDMLGGQPHPPYHQPMPPTGNPMPPTHQPMPPTDSGVTYPVAEVKASYLNVRSGPGVDNSVVGRLTQNTKVYLVARSSGGKWVLIQSQPANGWVNRYYLHTDFPYTSLPVAGSGQPMPPNQPQQPIYRPGVVVNSSALNVRSGPGVQYRAIAVATGGTSVEVISREANGWVQIRLPTGTVGFVNGAYLTSQ